MSSIFHHDFAAREHGLKSHLIFGAVYPLFIACEGLSRAIARFFVGEDAGVDAPRPLLAQARANASIATSYALMARTMLQSSARTNRSERLS